MPGDLLGLVCGGRVLIDRDAAGRGWFVDLTPETDEEFVLPAGRAVAPAAIERVGLLTAVLHELGHVLGLEHEEAVDPPDALMAEELGPGIRRLPNPRLVDDLFARW